LRVNLLVDVHREIARLWLKSGAGAGEDRNAAMRRQAKMQSRAAEL
jgi:hypothetical protein